MRTIFNETLTIFSGSLKALPIALPISPVKVEVQLLELSGLWVRGGGVIKRHAHFIEEAGTLDRNSIGQTPNCKRLQRYYVYVQNMLRTGGTFKLDMVLMKFLNGGLTVELIRIKLFEHVLHLPEGQALRRTARKDMIPTEEKTEFCFTLLLMRNTRTVQESLDGD